MRLGLCLGFLAVSLAAGLAGEQAYQPLRVTKRPVAGGTEIWAENRDPNAVRWLWVELAGAQNTVADVALPGGFVLDPLESRRLFTLRERFPGQGSSFALDNLRSGEGDPRQEPDRDAVYRLPWAHGQKHLVTQGYFGKVTHQGLYALDFDLNEGTPVLAARDGVVIAAKSDSQEGGMGPSFAFEGNFVELLHADATWAIYAHLAYHGALVQVGQRVLAGQPIGLSGHTGLASGPHLHFAVYRATFDGPKTIPTVFYTGATRTASLAEGRTYYAWQAGLPPFVEHLGADLDEGQLRRITRTVSGPVTVRQERIDRRTLVWADNGSAQAQRMTVDMDHAQNVRASAALPWTATVPPHTEVYCFFVDYLGVDGGAFQLNILNSPLP
jgi:murein DD-endopeptidase MepM/ murein hydrolase activator NlpD